MFPILYTREETQFTTNGIGRLSDAISVLVTEERNGIFELEMQYPITGPLYSELQEGRIISCTHDEVGDRQPFRIYRKSAPINGIVTFNAHHISYELANVVIGPFTATSPSAALSGFTSNALTDQPFTFWTDKSNNGTFVISHPVNNREILGGVEGSLIDIFHGGEFEFDKRTVKFYASRGSNSGVTIRYSKNLTDITQTIEDGGTYNAVLPYYYSAEDNTLVIGSVVNGNGTKFKAYLNEENKIPITDQNGNPIDVEYFQQIVKPVDFTDYYFNLGIVPTAAQLEARASTFLSNNRPWLPNENLKINFVQLWQTDEYANVAVLQRVKLCDTVNVYYPELGVISAQIKVIKVVWNALLERYDSMELGDKRASFAESINDEIEALGEHTESQIAGQVSGFNDLIQQAIDDATALITGGDGGNVVIVQDANGKPTEILIMDTADVQTAVKVIRMNMNGIGFSSTGINGPYTTAWTINGAFVADFITAGTMLANRIQGGTLTLGGANNGNGTLIIQDANGVTVTTGNNSGITTTRLTATDYVYVNGTTNSYLKIPMNNGGTQYLQVSNSGFWIQTENGDMRISPLQYVSSDPYTPNGYIGSIQAQSIINGKYWGSFVDSYGVNVTYGTWSGGSGTPVSFGRYHPGWLWIKDNNTGYQTEFDASDGVFYINGTFSVNGSKNRRVMTEEFGERLLYCYETPSPLFGDVGEGTTGEDGRAYIWLDPILAEAINTNQYQVFLQAYAEGTFYVAERHANYFVVVGPSGAAFGWELKARQAGYEMKRIDKFDKSKPEKSQDLGGLAYDHIKELEEGRITA